GWDVAGVVEQVGPAVVDLAVGDEVYAYGRKTEVAEGTYAELVSLPAAMVARKPAGLSFTQAAGVPLAGLTAWQALVEAADVQSGERVLVQAAAGGVGHLAVQIAVARGAEVIGSASPANHDFVRSLGATEVIDYSAGPVAGQVDPQVDVLFDLFGGDALADARGAVRRGGRVVSIAEPQPAGDSDNDLQGHYVFVHPSADGLDALTALFDAGDLRVEVAATYPLEQAAAAHERLEEGHVRGKLVLEVSSS
ncbi:MAG: NADP-dependent oxidoreductase, partial [Actinomycetota bacterium]|nr:NADP-dependent oxidoreductase [Actinomycetota bacterium]